VSLPGYLRIHELLISVAILAGSYVAARLLSLLFGKVITSTAATSDAALDHRLAMALRGPLTNALFLVGAYMALHRLPEREGWVNRADGVLFVVGTLLLGLALVRSYTILLVWYTTESRHAAGDGLAQEFGPLFSKLGKLLIVTVAAMVVLHHFSVSVSSLVVSLGVGSLAVGLAAQETLSNMFAGFTLMLDRPFRIGDQIQLSTGETGIVRAIGMRATRIFTPDETTLIVPNSLLVRERLLNHAEPSRQVTARIEVGVAYGTDLEKVKAILRESALLSEFVDGQRLPITLVTRLADSAVSLLLIFWVRDYSHLGMAKSQVYEEIYRRFRDAKVEISLPVRKMIQEAVPIPAAPAAPRR